MAIVLWLRGIMHGMGTADIERQTSHENIAVGKRECCHDADPPRAVVV